MGYTAVSKRSIAMFFLVLLIFSASSLFAVEVGKFYYKGDIKTLKNDTTILVNDTIVAMSEKVRAFSDVEADTISAPPSIFFILDNSTSMSGANGNDVLGNRFTVTSALIDSLMKYFPMAEVGVSVFTGGLHFDPASKPGIFQTVTSPTRMGLDSTGAFVPLLTLSQTYGTQTGYEILKEVLATDAGKLTYPSISTLPTGTNINAGFDAAIQAFSTAKFTKENQYIIFLSDGEANRPQNGTSSAFTAATSCPTTYTVYFTKQNTVPTTIRSYTTACQANNYSTRNPNSNNWAYNNTTFEALMDFLMTNVFRSIINSSVIVPATLTVNGQSSNAWVAADSTFTFGSLFPLIAEVTPFNVQLINAQKEAITSSFKVQTQAGLGRNWRTPYDVKLWDRTIVFQTTAGATVTTISRSMDAFQVRFDFDPGDANYTYKTASIEISNTNSTVRDRVVVNLTKGAGNFFTGQVNRVVAATANPTNNILEHAAVDTFIAVFRNSETPKLPLDTLRVSIPVVISPNAVVLNAATKDNNGNGYIDAINITFDNDTSVLSSATTGFSVRYGAVVLPVTGVERTPGGSVRQWRLLIGEPTGAALATASLQTSWTPTLTLTDFARINNGTIICVDSCPPVIYRVIKVITDANKRTTDSVKVMFSEKIYGSTGGQFNISMNQPPNTFSVWWGNTDVSADSLLVGINTFNRIATDSVLYFMMSNDKDLGAQNWMNIKTASILIRDKPGNTPTSKNRKVPVELQTISIIKTFPNPATATKRQINIGEDITIEVVKPGEKSKAKQIVLVEKNGGAIISIEGIIIPPPNTGTVTLTMKIYDVAGNSVNYIRSDDLFGASAIPGTSIYLYWNGFNFQKMKVAPGVYRAVVYVDYPPLSNIKDIKTISTVGIAQ
jgi:hypothetical protein